MKANLGFPVQSDVKKIPNAIALTGKGFDKVRRERL